jgi:Mn2+/Fe2+ NRAMP family transporter
VNRPKLMGTYRNTKFQNAIAWGTSAIVILLTVAMVWTTALGQ